MDRTPLTCVQCGQPLPERSSGSTRERSAARSGLHADQLGELPTAMENEDERPGRRSASQRERELRAEIPERPIPPDELTALRASAADRRRRWRRRAPTCSARRSGRRSGRGWRMSGKRLTERIAAAEQELVKAEWGISLKATRSRGTKQLAEQVERAVQALADAGAAVKTAEAEARHARAELERCQEADRKRTALLAEAETARKAAEQHRLVSDGTGRRRGAVAPAGARGAAHRGDRHRPAGAVLRRPVAGADRASAHGRAGQQAEGDRGRASSSCATANRRRSLRRRSGPRRAAPGDPERRRKRSGSRPRCPRRSAGCDRSA